ncbi:MAG: ABC transporter ATP-binding protein [Firmicutes bacterium]|nr:ABC transporter ATP-binding protein [Bacillota bacterium]HPU01323.1 ABC transporter ATP-binding protein [Bacillota bacterium]
MALEDVDFQIKRKEIVSLIGPNGAGKTTLFNLFTGHYNPTRGEIYFNNRKINGLKPYQVTPIGIARTFQNIRLFGQMSVLENVLVGQHCRTRSGLFDAILRTRGFRQEEARARKVALEMLAFVRLEEKKDEKACNLSYGEQRRLEMARALATNPSLLLLDEPAAGMNPQETTSLMELVRQIRDQMGITILLIEHDMKVVMGISERVAVLNYGRKIAEGTPREVQNNEEVIRAYLGESA